MTADILEKPDTDTVVLDETILDDVLMCIFRDAPAEVRVAHRCCGHAAFGCEPYFRKWEAASRARFALVGILVSGLGCMECGAKHRTFEDAYRVTPV